MSEKKLKIREACGYYALDIPNYNGSNFSLFFNSKRNAENVKRIIEIDESKPNEATVFNILHITHGKWEEIRDAYGELEGWIHTECGREVKAKEKYCPSCGAKMDRERE